ncbi:MAG: hypothetical protein M1821_006297 [Bathelium mastoideum]|nr:MAG: hypothetical protein M1821_006297 [Bathelium mastoideum]KAI9686641.1 MAG: hypothetical protein M1822_003652 [Bathelium mastoideum]
MAIVAPIPSRADEQYPETKRKTFLYLAYGSNLAAETFRGRRGIQPLSQVNVVVPELRMTFDLPGIPYSEPCFANSAKRNAESVSDGSGRSKNLSLSIDGTSVLPLNHTGQRRDYHKDRWHKGLVGVVYEVTPSDFAHIIATEGTSYNDILVQCYPLPEGSSTVPLQPDNRSFAAHTLFAPALPLGVAPGKGGRLQRPDTSYAQPSARYLNLITSGAEECKLPDEYRAYLGSIRSYTITTQRQRLGQAALMAVWGPILIFLFTVLMPMFSDDQGRAPQWLRKLAETVFSSVWISYDNVFKGVFGDGERTLSSPDAAWSKHRNAAKVEPDSTNEKLGSGLVAPILG